MQNLSFMQLKLKSHQVLTFLFTLLDRSVEFQLDIETTWHLLDVLPAIPLIHFHRLSVFKLPIS